MLIIGIFLGVRMNKNYRFAVPEKKKIRLIVDTDCKNEADDQFAVAHFLMTDKFIVKGLIASHFEMNHYIYGKEKTMAASLAEINKVVDIMGLTDEYEHKIFPGAVTALDNEIIPNFSVIAAHGGAEELLRNAAPKPSWGSEFIIEEALQTDDDRPLFIACLGSLTNLASAILARPEICERMTAVCIVGGPYPTGGFEFNLIQDIAAANVVFSSAMPLWQIPENAFKQIAVSLAELQVRVAPYGDIGEYLFTQMVEFNDRMGDVLGWPPGESWGIGDQVTITVLLEEGRRGNYEWRPAPVVSPDMFYVQNPNSRVIKVYNSLDVRFTMEDFYAKLMLNYGNK
jgi:inosine-uridine nucleoside N-ribohydrolase